jgi:hypothetical protein
MWNKLLSLAAQFWKLADENERNRKQIEALESDVHSLWRALDRLAGEVQRTREHDAHEREKLVLALQNELLKFERRPPPPRKG